jgi:hypothetical protein
MDVRAHFLARLCRTECSDDRNLRRDLPRRGTCIAAKKRVKLRWCGLVGIDAVQTEAERLHGERAWSCSRSVEQVGKRPPGESSDDLQLTCNSFR